MIYIKPTLRSNQTLITVSLTCHNCDGHTQFTWITKKTLCQNALWTIKEEEKFMSLSSHISTIHIMESCQQKC
jgi:hypothetical protein